MAKSRAITLLLLVLGCGDDTAATPDAMPDADFPANGGIGASCGRPDDPSCRQSSGAAAQGTCAMGMICMLSSCGGGSWPGGYCTKSCTSNVSCPVGAVCTPVIVGNIVQLCLQGCSAQQDCRAPSYACTQTNSGTSCLPGRACEPPPAQLERGDWGANLRVAAPMISNFQSEGNVVTDGQGHIAIAETAIYFGTGRTGNVMGAAVFDETTGTFQTPVAYGEYNVSSYTSDPVVAYDAEAPGSPKPLYMVWLDIQTDINGNASNIHVAVAKSTDGGITFGPPNGSAPAAVNTSGQEVQGADDVFDKPWIAASGGKVYVTYSVDGGSQENMVVSEDGGVTWTTGRSIGARSGRNFTQIAIARDTGDVFVTTGPRTLTAARWLRSMGAQWFEPEVTVPGAQIANPSANAVSRDGTHFWAVWDGPAATAGVLNVLASVAQDARGGAALSFPQTPVVVNEDSGCGLHVHSTVAVDDTGIGHVVWIDNRYAGSVLEGTVRYARSTTAAGTAFTPSVAVSDQLFPFNNTRVPGLWLGDYIGITTTATKVYATWADPRGGPPWRTHFFLAARPLP